MATREKVNRVKIERHRLSQVPVDPTETIYQGDQMVWNPSLQQATKQSGASGAQFVGISETSTPIETAGSHDFLSDPAAKRINVIQQGLVEQIVDVADNNVVYHPFDKVIYGGTNAQTVKLGSSNAIGFVDPGWVGTSGSRTVVTGDLVKIWLLVPDAYRAWH